MIRSALLIGLFVFVSSALAAPSHKGGSAGRDGSPSRAKTASKKGSASKTYWELRLTQDEMTDEKHALLYRPSDSPKGFALRITCSANPGEYTVALYRTDGDIWYAPGEWANSFLARVDENEPLAIKGSLDPVQADVVYFNSPAMVEQMLKGKTLYTEVFLGQTIKRTLVDFNLKKFKKRYKDCIKFMSE